MNRRGLLLLADLLEINAGAADGMRFSLRGWAKNRAAPDDPPALDRGSSGCALCLAALSGRFRGLSLAKRTDPLGGTQFVPVFAERSGYDAGAALFDISRDEARRLFSPRAYWFRKAGARGARKVARRIRALVADAARARR